MGGRCGGGDGSALPVVQATRLGVALQQVDMPAVVAVGGGTFTSLALGASRLESGEGRVGLRRVRVVFCHFGANGCRRGDIVQQSANHLITTLARFHCHLTLSC